MSQVEKINLSRDKRRAFRAGKFPEHLITKDMIRELEFTVECGAGSPNYKEFKVTEGMLLIKVPSQLTPPLEYCDNLLEVNGQKMKDNRHVRETFARLQKANKSQLIKIKVRRVVSTENVTENLPSNASIFRKYVDGNKPNTGYVYTRIVLIYFPRSKLGINVKAWDNYVYVDNTDNSWGSTTRRFLYSGDAILKVDNTEVSNIATFQASLRNGLQENGLVTMIVERTIDANSTLFVRCVLQFMKGSDPTMPSDVVAICKKLLDRYEKSKFSPEPKPIFTGYVKGKKPDKRVSHTGKNATRVVALDPIRPIYLMPCPDYTKQDNKM